MRTHERPSSAFRAALATGALLALCMGTLPAHAQTIAQQPLFLGEKASPNVVFNIDESWSMAWGYMPDEVRENGVSIYGNPWATGSGDAGDNAGSGNTDRFRWTLAFHPYDVSTGGAGTTGDDTTTGDGTVRTMVARANAQGVATDLISARLRSSAFNTIYYDPEVRYRPWYHHDGTPFPDAAPATAPLNPNNPSAGTVNLVGEQTFGGTSTATRTLSGPGACNSNTWSPWQTIPELTTISSFSTTGTCGTNPGSSNASQIETSGNQYRYRRFPGGGRTITFTETLPSVTWCGSLVNSTPNSTTSTNLSVENGATNTERSNFCRSISGETLAPAVYYTYNGNGLRTASNFTRVRVMDHATFQRGAGRSDCAQIAAGIGNTCTQAEEYQNFANWFTYNRTRMFASIAATSRAFSEQSDNLRVGYARIHGPAVTLDGASSPGTMERGVRDFSGADREQFFTWLHNLGGVAHTPASNGGRGSLYGFAGTHHRFAGGTPLRQAMDDVGQYFMRSDNPGPWGNTPGTNDSTAHLSCRKNYHILMTDGMWTGNMTSTLTARHADRRANVDNTAGPAISGTGDLNYQYDPKAPYSDTTANTLADVAMYYWNRDLRPNLTNNVPPDAFNPAFWQNMVNFTVGFGVSGTLNYPDDLAALQAGTKFWPTVAANTPSAIDDLWHAAINSRGEYLSATNPEEFASGLSGILKSVAAREGASSSTAAISSTRLDTDTVAYRATFSSADWSGRLGAYPRLDGTNEFDFDNPLWDTDATLTRDQVAGRNIFTADGVTGSIINSAVALIWNELDDPIKAVISDTDDDSIVEWVRGSAANENSSLRKRTHLLGDIVNSNPFYVGNRENYGYRFLPGTEGSSYTTFLTSVKSGRTPMVYVGANDGMLHGFDAGTGSEIFAFVPAGVAANLKTLASPLYTHQYFVDGSPRAGDAYLGGWKTVLVGGTGAGGKSVFALDITDPDEVGPDKFLWEFSTAPDATDKLGVAMSNPVIARVKADNKWVAIFGNGYESNDTVKLMVVDLATGELIKSINTSATGVNNGLASPFPVDLTGNGITDYVYAGDLQGAMWRFDLRNADSNLWSVTKIFQASDDANQAQPITARVEVGRHPTSGVMVYFGTGKYFQDGDNIVAANPQVQTLYGVHDTLNPGDTQLIARNRLVPQTILFQGIPTLVGGGTGALSRVVSKLLANQCSSVTPCRGWRLNLKAPSPATANGERSVARPILRHGRVAFTTIIPNDDPCLFGGQSWQMEIDAIAGGRTDRVVFDLNGDILFNANDHVQMVIDGETVNIPTSGYLIGELSNTPAVVSAGNTDLNITTQGGQFFTSGSGNEFSRQSWRQLQ